MRFDRGQDFLDWSEKRLAFIGMSGAGKSSLAAYLDPAAWVQFCTDFDLADGPLRPELVQFAGADFPCGPHDISVLSAYVGKLGDGRHGGLDLAEFRRRQRQHEVAERQTFENLIHRLDLHQGPAIVDAGGSLVEILNFDAPDGLRLALNQRVLFVYIEADEQQSQRLIERQLKAPKPMYYRPDFLDAALASYGQDIDTAHPDDFIRYVFPRLMADRRPRYAALAAEGGVTLPLSRANAVRSDGQLLSLIAEAIDAA